MNEQEMKPVVEAILMTAGEPVSMDRLGRLLADGRSKPKKDVIGRVLDALREDYDERGVELIESASGFRFRARSEFAARVGRLWEERPPRYSRAFLETLAIIAYRQPITRGEIEHIRGVAVSTNIMRQLLEREWVKVVGHRDVPGRPAVFATTNEFLDYFGLKSLEALPTLADLKPVEDINPDLFAETLPVAAEAGAADGASADAAMSEQTAGEAGVGAAREAGEDTGEEAGEDTAGDDHGTPADTDEPHSAQEPGSAPADDDAAPSAATG